MRLFLLTFAIAGAAGFAAPAVAQSWSSPPSFYYQGPDGTYDSLGDLSRSIRGVPCGIECTQRAEVRWGMIRHRAYDADRY